MGTQLVAVVVAIAAGFCFTASFALQQRANLRVMAAADRSGSEAVAVVRQPDWIGGMVLQVVGFALQAVALGIGALAVVQPALVTEFVFMVPASAWVVHTTIVRRDWYGAVLVITGLVLFELSARPEPGLETAGFTRWWPASVICLAVFAGLMAVAERLPDYRAALRGAAVGVWGGLAGALSKQFAENVPVGFPHLVTTWSTWALFVVGVLNILWVNLALRAGRLASAQATMASIAPLASLGFAVTVFDEHLRAGPGPIAGALGGIAVAGAGIVMLARSPSLLALGGRLEPEPGSVAS